MSSVLSSDPSLAMQELDAQDLVHRKQAMDKMRSGLSGAKDEKAKLRESCEGFEAIFIQKIWEQMRKNVQQDGYLHSKDESMYQGMYDHEFSRKMASAGGIGLADMLYDQLSQRLGETSRTTSPGRNPALPIIPAISSPGALRSLAPAPLKPELKSLKPLRPPYEVSPDSGKTPEDKAAEWQPFNADLREETPATPAMSVAPATPATSVAPKELNKWL